MVMMAHRKNYGQKEAMQALNLVDLVWHKSKDVRDAWAEFHASIQEGSGFSASQIADKYRRLLSAIAADLGLGSSLSSADFDRIYYSNIVGWREDLEGLQMRRALAELQEGARQGDGD